MLLGVGGSIVKVRRKRRLLVDWKHRAGVEHSRHRVSGAVVDEEEALM